MLFDLGPAQFYLFVMRFFGGAGRGHALHRDTVLIPAGAWVLVDEFLSTACSVQWASDWHQILVSFH